MANSAQARKRARQADGQRAHNASLRSTLRTAIKRVRQAIDAGDKAAAQTVFQQSVAVLDRFLQHVDEGPSEGFGHWHEIAS